MASRLGGTSYHVKKSIDPYGHVEFDPDPDPDPDQDQDQDSK